MGSIETPESSQTETASKIKASDFDLKGHLGHLDQKQQSAFDEFKSKVQDEIQLEAGQRQWWNDSTLLRYLRARSYNVELAFKQFQSTDQWRKEKKVDELYENFSVEDFEEARKFYPRWTGRRDKIGRPVYVYRIASLAGENTKELYKNDDSKRYDRIICLTEVLDRFIFPLTSDIPSSSNPTPISCVTTIIDLDQLSFKTLWSLRSHLQQSITLNSSHSPETLSTIGIVNAPGFMSTLWNLIKKWFDEGTMKKIHILSKNPGEVLKEIIDENDLPEIYGGQLNWKYEDEPSLDAEIKKKLGRETLPKGPLIWTEEGVKEVGSGREIKEESQAEESKE